eukprot:TRINITY_DN13821_c0_g1_i1.p1 TRINITY_DN13821_c0_g1~~TRINITY_DN13821_c0_g1_i1.p1  ORF type:complete len:408 (-),score=96.51 TRINITY_DN13821_c0_g1_i1:79-1302(-)
MSSKKKTSKYTNAFLDVKKKKNHKRSKSAEGYEKNNSNNKNENNNNNNTDEKKIYLQQQRHLFRDITLGTLIEKLKEEKDINPNLIKFNISGKIVTTYVQNLKPKDDEENFFTGLMRRIENEKRGKKNNFLNLSNITDPCSLIERDDDGNWFLDRNENLFQIVLDYLRFGKIYFPLKESPEQILEEFDYFLIRLPIQLEAKLREMAYMNIGCDVFDENQNFKNNNNNIKENKSFKSKLLFTGIVQAEKWKELAGIWVQENVVHFENQIIYLTEEAGCTSCKLFLSKNQDNNCFFQTKFVRVSISNSLDNKIWWGYVCQYISNYFGHTVDVNISTIASPKDDLIKFTTTNMVNYKAIVLNWERLLNIYPNLKSINHTQAKIIDFLEGCTVEEREIGTAIKTVSFGGYK